jgi:predicted transcriptional regulator
MELLAYLHCTPEGERYAERAQRKTGMSNSHLRSLMLVFEDLGLIERHEKRHRKMIVLTAHGMKLADSVLRMKELVLDCRSSGKGK